MDDAELAKREGYAKMAMGAADAQTTPGLDDDSRTVFQTFLRMFSASAGVPVDGLDTLLNPRRRRLSRRILTTAVLVLTLGGAYTIADSQLNPPPVTKQWKPSFDPLLAQARAQDPQHRAPWGVRSYVSSGGKRCVTVGQVVNGRLVAPAGGGEVRAGGGPTCLQADHSTMVNVSNYGGPHPRSVLYGVAARGDQVSVGIRAPGEPVPVADDGTFVYVVAGVKALARYKAYITSDDGRTVVRTLGTG